MKLGSLFSGAGLLDLAVEEVFGARTVWVSDIEPGPRKVLAHRYPHAPNLGDITAVDWSQVEPVDIIAGGSPCQDISAAGRMAGMRAGTRSNLWVEMREAIRALQPAYVIWENVYAARSTAAASAMESDPRLLGDHPNGQPVLRALGRVLGDLAELGFDAEWHSLRAADVGAPHGRARYFILAAHAERVARGERRIATAGQATGGRPLGATARRDRSPLALLPTPKATDDRAHSEGDLRRNDPGLRTLPSLLPTPAAGNFNASEDPDQWEARRQRVKETANNGNGMGMPLGIAVKLLPTPKASNNEKRLSPGYGMNLGQGVTPSAGHERRSIATHNAWGPYAAAIARWETIVGPAPAPTKPGRNGRPKLNPAFAEWMMGAPAGWITDVPGVTDNEALRMAGNGVVRQQAVAALRLMLNRMEVAV